MTFVLHDWLEWVRVGADAGGDDGASIGAKGMMLAREYWGREWWRQIRLSAMTCLGAAANTHVEVLNTGNRGLCVGSSKALRDSCGGFHCGKGQQAVLYIRTDWVCCRIGEGPISS